MAATESQRGFSHPAGAQGHVGLEQAVVGPRDCSQFVPEPAFGCAGAIVGDDLRPHEDQGAGGSGEEESAPVFYDVAVAHCPQRPDDAPGTSRPAVLEQGHVPQQPSLKVGALRVGGVLGDGLLLAVVAGERPAHAQPVGGGARRHQLQDGQPMRPRDEGTAPNRPSRPLPRRADFARAHVLPALIPAHRLIARPDKTTSRAGTRGSVQCFSPKPRWRARATTSSAAPW